MSQILEIKVIKYTAQCKKGYAMISTKGIFRKICKMFCIVKFFKIIYIS